MRLTQNTGGALSSAERNTLVTGLQTGPRRGTLCCEKIAEDNDFKTSQSNRAFVLMEYFGYLRRNPTEAPDTDFTGYDFWLTKP